MEIGISDDDYAQVLSGLQEGDTVAYIAAVSSSGDMAMMMPGMMGGGMTAMPSGGMPSGGGNMGGNRGGGPGGGF